MKYKVFVDGQEGTTGLEINERLSGHSHVEMIRISPELRKDPAERSRLINQADIVFLCLPDAAAREAVSLVENPRVRVIDASTAHRTAEGWAYGLPELSSAHRKAIAQAGRVSVPGCYATGFNALVYPLTCQGVLGPDAPITVHALSGYSGGGKSLISKYRGDRPPCDRLHAPAFYALGLNHKHLPEMRKVCGLSHDPLFNPIVCDYYKGMLVSVPLHASIMRRRASARDVWNIMAEHYAGQRFVKVLPFDDPANLEEGFFFPEGCNGTNRLEILVSGREDQVSLIARLDNLGKGSSGAAVQCMNIMLGLDEGEGLVG